MIGMLEYIDHFNIDDATIRRLFSLALSRGGTYCDIFCEHTLKNLIKMEKAVNRVV